MGRGGRSSGGGRAAGRNRDSGGPQIVRTGRMGTNERGSRAEILSVEGVEFVRSRAAQVLGGETVLVNVERLNEAWSRNEGFFIPRGGGGAEIGGRREGVGRFLDQGRPIDMSQIHVSRSGEVSFSDGRHRFSVLRDRGMTHVPVSISGSVSTARRLFGA